MLSFLIKSVLLILFFFSCWGRLWAQVVFPPLPYALKPRIQAQPALQRITIDGKLDEGDWTGCKAATKFLVCYPDQGKKPSYDTKVMVLYDSVNLYIGAVCYFGGRKKSLQVQSMRRDFGFSDNELLSVFIEPFQNSHLPVSGFYVSPYGNQTDIAYYNTVAYDYNWDAVWNARATIGDSAWTAEIAIPFSSLRYPRDSTEWSINFDRNIRNKGEYTGWSPWPMAYDPSRIIYGGLLTNLHPPHPDLNLRLQPYGLVKTSSGSGQVRATRPAPGGELKWALNTNTVADVTVNTDFAQADVDRQVVNLTRSSVFFPEKRQFFKENANLFSAGGDGMLQPFFTRRIGLSDDGHPVAIDGGLRLVHQSDKQSAGLLFMRQEGDTTTRPSWFNVLRYKGELGKWQVGAMTVMRYNEGDGKVPGEWNAVAAVDAFVKLSEACYVRQMVSASSDQALAFKGFASFTELNFSTSKVFAGLLTAIAGKGYSARAGFMERQDFMHNQPSFQLFLRPKGLPAAVSFYNPIFSADIYHQASTLGLQEINAVISPAGFLTRTGGEVRLNTLYSYEHIGQSFSPVNGVDIGPGKYRFLRWELYCRTNQAAHYSVETRVSTGKYYDIRLNSYYVAVRIVPVPQVAFGCGFTENHFSGAGSGPGTRNTFLVAPELRLAWNARLQLSSFYQYNTDENTGSLNVRFSWEYKPLSFVYLVVNSNAHLHAPALHEQTSILKGTYIKQL
jgi:hypothetical protein